MPVDNFHTSRLHEKSSRTDQWIKHHKDELLKYIHQCLPGHTCWRIVHNSNFVHSKKNGSYVSCWAREEQALSCRVQMGLKQKATNYPVLEIFCVSMWHTEGVHNLMWNISRKAVHGGGKFCLIWVQTPRHCDVCHRRTARAIWEQSACSVNTVLPKWLHNYFTIILTHLNW